MGRRDDSVAAAFGPAFAHRLTLTPPPALGAPSGVRVHDLVDLNPLLARRLVAWAAPALIRCSAVRAWWSAGRVVVGDGLHDFRWIAARRCSGGRAAADLEAAEEWMYYDGQIMDLPPLLLVRLATGIPHRGALPWDLRCGMAQRSCCCASPRWSCHQWSERCQKGTAARCVSAIAEARRRHRDGRVGAGVLASGLAGIPGSAATPSCSSAGEGVAMSVNGGSFRGGAGGRGLPLSACSAVGHAARTEPVVNLQWGHRKQAHAEGGPARRKFPVHRSRIGRDRRRVQQGGRRDRRPHVDSGSTTRFSGGLPWCGRSGVGTPTRWPGRTWQARALVEQNPSASLPVATCRTGHQRMRVGRCGCACRSIHRCSRHERGALPAQERRRLPAQSMSLPGACLSAALMAAARAASRSCSARW